MKRILITGGFGFLGRHLIEELAKNAPHLELTAVDLQEGTAAPREGVRYRGGIDILDPASLAGAFRGMDAVIHLAGLVSFWSGDRERLFRINQIGTRNVSTACVRAGVKRLVHVSSVAAIGFNDREDAPADESLPFDWSQVRGKHYMLSKRASELELEAAEAAGISVVVANPGLMYGPGDRTNVALFQGVQAGRLRLVPPGGTNVVDVRDVAAGLRLLLLSNERGERFILGGQNLRFSDVVRTIGRVLGTPVAPGVLPRWLHKPICAVAGVLERVRSRKPALTSDHLDSSFLFRYFSSRKAARRLGWRPQISFARTVEDAARDLVRAGLLQPLAGA